VQKKQLEMGGDYYVQNFKRFNKDLKIQTL
jgi:hypothetical protein